MLLEVRGLTKRFGQLVANDAIDLTLEPGAIHGLLGENGAGKSTLMNLLFGLLQPDAGQILIDGTPVTFTSPADAIARGIGMVHQHFKLVGPLTVAENVVLGDEPTLSGGRFDRAAAIEWTRELSDRFGLAVDPLARVEDLPVGMQQRVEILKALRSDAQVLILDEPTAVLTPGESDELFAAVRGLADDGRAVAFISHKLREHRALADVVTVLRRGAVVGSADPQEADDATLAEMMVGRPVILTVDKAVSAPGEVVLELADVTGDGLRGLSLEVRTGEIVGVAGVSGNGQHGLVRAVMGTADTTGTATINGNDTASATRRDWLTSGVGHVPADRSRDGLIGAFTIADNLVLDRHDESPYASGWKRNIGHIRDWANTTVERFDIRAEDASMRASQLSGGNQQKVVVARALDRDLTLLIAEEPTRGVDVGAIEYLHGQVVAARDHGAGVLLISSELDEVLALSDRVAVMFDGELFGPFDAPVDRGMIGQLMAGKTDALTGSHPTPDGSGSERDDE